MYNADHWLFDVSLILLTYFCFPFLFFFFSVVFFFFFFFQVQIYLFCSLDQLWICLDGAGRATTIYIFRYKIMNLTLSRQCDRPMTSTGRGSKTMRLDVIHRQINASKNIVRPEANRDRAGFTCVFVYLHVGASSHDQNIR